MNSSVFNKDCGLLMHPTSLPNAYGVGDFGPCAIQWLEQLAQSGQNIWQILPLNPAGYGDSPYQGLSAFAANPVFLSPEAFYAEGLLEDHELRVLELTNDECIDYTSVYRNKSELVARASLHFFELSLTHPLRVQYEDFIRKEADWIEDFALYSALKRQHNLVAWTDWPEVFRDRDPVALKAFAEDNPLDLNRVRFEQFFLAQQWATVRETAQRFKIRIVGDLPIFVAHDSADVWCHRELFRLNEDGSPSVVAGVPPDYFSETGQLWGNPLYAWETHRADGFAWWRQRLKKILQWVDVVRVDHFRGFDACWEIPGGAETAVDGRWVNAPGREVFDKFVEDWGMPLPVIAEDLGVITPEVVALRDDFQLPGIRIEQFAFGNDEMRHTFLPEVYDGSCVAYTGTHDNDTVVGWFNSGVGKGTTRSQADVDKERTQTLDYFGTDGSEIHKDFIRQLYTSQAGATIVPVQDLLGLGSEARMNTPGVASGSWRWRLTDFASLIEPFDELLQLTKDCQRGTAAYANAAIHA